jgi:hypothetical protein
MSERESVGDDTSDSSLLAAALEGWSNSNEEIASAEGAADTAGDVGAGEVSSHLGSLTGSGPQRANAKPDAAECERSCDSPRPARLVIEKFCARGEAKACRAQSERRAAASWYGGDCREPGVDDPEGSRPASLSRVVRP